MRRHCHPCRQTRNLAWELGLNDAIVKWTTLPADAPHAQQGAQRYGDGDCDLRDHSAKAAEGRRGGEAQLSAVVGLYQCGLSISGTLEPGGQPHLEVRVWVMPL